MEVNIILTVLTGDHLSFIISRHTIPSEKTIYRVQPSGYHWDGKWELQIEQLEAQMGSPRKNATVRQTCHLSKKHGPKLPSQGESSGPEIIASHIKRSSIFVGDALMPYSQSSLSMYT